MLLLFTLKSPYSFCSVGLRGGPRLGAPSLGFAVGGAKDVNNFRENIQNNYLPIITDLSYEGIFNDYFFDTGNQQQDNNEKNLFCPSYSIAITKDPLQEDQEQQSYEYYMSVGLNSNLNENTFKRNPLNLLICIDVSGSMSSPFNRYHYDQRRSNTYVDRVYQRRRHQIHSLNRLGITTTIMHMIIVQKLK